MSVIVGIDRKPGQVKELLTGYLETYFEAMDKAIEEAGGSLRTSFDGDDPWVPGFPDALRPPWVSKVRVNHDGGHFYIDLDGPVQHGVHVTQAIEVQLDWVDESSPTGFEIAGVEITSVRIFLVDDTYLELGEARAVTNGLIAAGKLMASLLEGQV